MNRSRTRKNTVTRGVIAPIAVGILISIAGLGTACASRGGAGAIERLAAAADHERTHELLPVPPPPSVPPEQITPVPEDPADIGRLPRDTAIARVLSTVEPPVADNTPEPTPDAQAEALRLYLQGKSRLSGEDPTGAQEDLMASLRLDQRPAEVWRELGEAQLQLGNRNGALLAYQQAAAREPDDERTLEQLGRLAMDRKDYTLALQHLVRLSRRPLAQIDPALPYIVNAQLGRAFTALGYVTAGVDCLRDAVNLPDRFNQSTTRTEELGAIYRQRGDMCRDIGDSLLRLGRFDEAADAYAESARYPTLNPGSIAPRRAYALLRQGRKSGAGVVVIDEVLAARGRCDSRVLDLISYVVSAAPSLRGPLADAIDAVPARLSESDRALAVGSLLRARAAALGPEAGIASLREHLQKHPGDEAALLDLLSARRDAPASDILAEVTALVRAAPLYEVRYVQAATRIGVTAADLLAASDALPPAEASQAPARLVRARLLMILGRAREASEILTGLLEADPANSAATVAQVRALGALGRRGEADELLAHFSEDSDPAQRYAKAVALADRDDAQAALNLLTPLLDGTVSGPGVPPRGELAMLAARLAMRLERAEDAERWYQLAILSDPGRDEAYAGLMRLYSPNQPLASEEKLIATAQALRAAVPSSPTLRWLRARENAARGQYDAAERELVDLDEQYPDQSDVLDLLMSIWTRAGSLDHAEQWLRQRMERVPGSREYPLRLADVLATQNDKATEARDVLEALVARSPGDLAALRRLENVLRDKLDDEKRADEIALSRLDRSPRTMDSSLERATIQLRAGNGDEALAAASDAVGRAGADPSPERLARLTAIVVKITQDADRIKASPAAASGVQTTIVERFPAVAPQAHAARIIYLARYTRDIETLIGAIDLAVDTHEAMREGAALLAIRELVRGNDAEDVVTGTERERIVQRVHDALRIAEHNVTRTATPSASGMAMWIAMTVDASDAASLDRALAYAQEKSVLDAALDSMTSAGRAQDDIRIRARAVPFSSFAEVFMRAGNEQRADEMYRRALTCDPEHAQSNNGLGYRLLERDESIAEAERMIEVAYKQDPTAPEIIDSMGWARYKRGIIHNEVDEQGRVTRRGAISLLAQALSVAQKEGALPAVPVLTDHLADALWAGGEHERAVGLWENARSMAEQILARVVDTENSALARELEATIKGAEAKAAAAHEDREPPISRIHEPVNHPPPNQTDELTVPDVR